MNELSDRYGEYCGASLILLPYALKHRTADKAIDFIDADKTMRLFDKIWAKKWEKNGSKGFNFPVEDINDKHGNRLAFSNKINDSTERKLEAVLDAIEYNNKMNNTPALRQLSISEENDGVTSIKYYKSLVTTFHLDYLIKQGIINLQDIDFIDQFGIVSKNIPRDEMIAIGRHENGKLTYQSILYEIENWCYWTETLINYLKNKSKDFSNEEIKQLRHYAWQLSSFAKELIIKASEEQKAYEQGFNKFIKSSQENEYYDLMNLFKETHNEHFKIWEYNQVQLLKFPCYYCNTFSKYIVGVLSNCTDLKEIFIKPKLSNTETKKSFNKLSKFNSYKVNQRPANFDIKEFEAFESDELKDDFVCDPEDIWLGKKGLEQFALQLENNYNYIYRNYVEPELLISRQEN